MAAGIENRWELAFSIRGFCAKVNPKQPTLALLCKDYGDLGGLMTTRQERMRKRVEKAVRDYRNDLWFRAEAAVQLSVIVNAFYAIYQTIQGIRFQSIWFGMLAVYYVMLTGTRLAIVRFLRPDATDGREELRRYRTCGWLLLILTLAVLGLGALVNFAGKHPVYPGSMIYVVGAFTLFTVVSGITSAFAYRKLESPLISASKAVAVACSLVSLYSLQAAALALTCTGDRTWIRQVMNVVSALIIFIIVSWMAIHIIVRATRALQGKEDLSYVVAANAKALDKDNNVEMEHYRAEAQRQLEAWQSYQGTKVEWRTYSGTHDRRDTRMQERLAQRDARRQAVRERKQRLKEQQKAWHQQMKEQAQRDRDKKELERQERRQQKRLEKQRKKRGLSDADEQEPLEGQGSAEEQSLQDAGQQSQ